MLTIPRLKETCGNEQVLMVLIARLYFKTQSREEIQAFIDENTIDWDLFYNMIRAHQVAAFVYSVAIAEKLRMDKGLEEKLKQHAQVISFNNLHQLKFVQHLLAEFKALGVQVIPYKGVGFASRYYQSLAQRESSDIDFLVNKTSVPALRAYFHEKGYIAKSDVPDDYLPYALSIFKEFSFKTPQDALGINCSVEIQWRLLEGYIGHFIDFDFLLPQLVESNVGGVSIKTLVPTYELLCVISHHIIKDPLIRFKYLVDIACLVDTCSDAINWDIIEQVMYQYGYQKIFSEGMTVINDLLGTPVYPGKVPVGRQQRLIGNALSFPVKWRTEANNVKALLLLSRLRDTASGNLNVKGRMFLYWLLPNIDDILVFKMPVVCMPLLFLVRAFRLLYKYLVAGGKYPARIMKASAPRTSL